MCPAPAPRDASSRPEIVSQEPAAGNWPAGRARSPGSGQDRTRGSVGIVLRRLLLLAGHHGPGLALEVDVRIAADVDGDPLDRAAGEAVR